MTMQDSKRKKLEAAGWKVGSVDEFLGLTPEESAYIEMKLALSHTLRQRRLHNKLSQIELAKMVHSSQSRIAKMEAGDPSVSIDLIMKSLLALGASPKDVAKAISSGASHAA
jgi:DNA-binding XRE family transcriptional regulator